jgi:hypothetical protein
MQMDTGFRPSTHGFGFPNTWHDLVLGVFTSRGRCGGMVFAALDRFAAGVPLAPIEQSRALPDHRSPLAHHIWRRQVESIVARLGGNLWRFAWLTYLPSHAPAGSCARPSTARCLRTSRTEASRAAGSRSERSW